MPRVSIRRLLFYTAYTLVGTSLIMLALHVQSQSWLRVLDPSAVGAAQGAADVDAEDLPNADVLLKEGDEPEQTSEADSNDRQAEELVSNTTNLLRRRGLPWYIKDDGYRPLPNETMANIWPGRFSGDRIENQLMIPYTGSADAPLKTIYLPNGLNSWQVKGGQKLFLEQNCPVNRCSLTGKRDDAATADAIMFKDYFSAPSHKRPMNQIWIMYMLECPLHTQYIREKDVFNWSATYRSDSELVAPYEKWVYFDENVRRKPVTFNHAANKTKKVAWFVSNCGAKNNRLEYAHELQKHIQVDIYGSCGTKHCPRHSGDHCLEILSKQYKFYLAFENSNCRDYITEKFYVNGLGSQVLPIVMGAPRVDYEKHAPEHSFIHVDDFESPKELANFLNLLDQNDTLYNEYFEWRDTGQFINTYFFCRLCSMLHEAPSAQPRHYHDFNDWWRGGFNCIKGSWRAFEGYQKITKSKKKTKIASAYNLLPPAA